MCFIVCNGKRRSKQIEIALANMNMNYYVFTCLHSLDSIPMAMATAAKKIEMRKLCNTSRSFGKLSAINSPESDPESFSISSKYRVE